MSTVSVKDQLWESTFDIVARTVDGMGKRIDTGIMGHTSVSTAERYVRSHPGQRCKNWGKSVLDNLK
jgi:hypothetical protein